MATTLEDYGRNSERYGQIPYFYVFPIRFWFAEDQISPDDVLTWCRENCEGYYKVVCYTHNSSRRKTSNPREYDVKRVYVDRVYLTDERDAVMIALAFNVSKTVIRRADKMNPLTRKDSE